MTQLRFLFLLSFRYSFYPFFCYNICFFFDLKLPPFHHFSLNYSVSVVCTGERRLFGLVLVLHSGDRQWYRTRMVDLMCIGGVVSYELRAQADQHACNGQDGCWHVLPGGATLPWHIQLSCFQQCFYCHGHIKTSGSHDSQARNSFFFRIIHATRTITVIFPFF